MLCEDVARMVKRVTDRVDWFADLWVRTEHNESLRPSDAVPVATTGVPGGFLRDFA